MNEYRVKIGFWLSAYDSVRIEAETDAEAIDKAKLAAKAAMESGSQPEHIEIAHRRQGHIAYIDRICRDGGQEQVIEDLAFDDDRIEPPPRA